MTIADRAQYALDGPMARATAELAGRTVKLISGSDYTAVDADVGFTFLLFNVNLIIPPGLQDGWYCGWLQIGGTQSQIIQGSGATLERKNGLKCNGQWAEGGVYRLVEASRYFVGGDLVP
jgi:hypothetical protein